MDETPMRFGSTLDPGLVNYAQKIVSSLLPHLLWPVQLQWKQKGRQRIC